MRFPTKQFTLLSGTAMLAVFSPSANAADEPASETTPPVAQPTGNRTIFTPADFERFAPRNALDMLRQVPGFTIREGEEARGLGQASGNVLVNSQRLSSKSDDIFTQLSRIPASTVERIELVDGAKLDIPGLTGQVANVVARSSSFSGQFRWSPEVRAHYADPRLTNGEISVTGRTGPVEYTISLTNNANRGAAGGPTVITDRTGAVTQTRKDVIKANRDEPKLAGRFTIDGPGSSVANINGSFERIPRGFTEHSVRTNADGSVLVRDLDDRSSARNWEIGGDFEFAVGPGRLKLIGLNRQEYEPYSQSVITTFADGSPAIGDRYAQTGDSTERIARAEYSWKMLGGDWQIAGEGAFNSLRNIAMIATLDSNGQFVDLPFPEGTGGVKEDRYDASLSFSRPLSKDLTLQLIAGAERSTLRQTGATGTQNNLSRAFFRPKGSLSLGWKAGKRLDVSFKLKRSVGQLSFYDFLARRFLDDGNANSGNADLVPQQDWSAELELNRTFGALGSTKLRLVGRNVQDYVTVVPIGTNGESIGNVDSAKERQIVSNTTVQFDPLGWKGARLDLNIELTFTSLKDPFDPARRIPYGFVTERYFEINFRQDFQGTDWAAGAWYEYNRQSLYHRRFELGRDYEGPVFAGLFVEHKDVMGLTVRASANNLLNGRQRWDRQVFDGPRPNAPIQFIETRDRLIGPIFQLSIKGNI
ncbi:TonB-dependent receptor plug domain-containing protein [Novosphingobium sp. ERN07]|nr:TonB-dependent receptor plug domain-containing protein [Novosphingobium sp. ERN07]